MKLYIFKTVWFNKHFFIYKIRRRLWKVCARIKSRFVLTQFQIPYQQFQTQVKEHWSTLWLTLKQIFSNKFCLPYQDLCTKAEGFYPPSPMEAPRIQLSSLFQLFELQSHEPASWMHFKLYILENRLGQSKGTLGSACDKRWEWGKLLRTENVLKVHNKTNFTKIF